MNRNDGLVNVANGVGTHRYDPALSNYIVRSQFITMQQSETMFLENGLFKKIVTLPADECLRSGFEICTDNDNDEDVNDCIKSKLEDLNAEMTFANALYWHRCYGGAMIYPVVEDGEEDLTQPLNINNVKSIDELRVYSPLEVVPEKTFELSTDRNYGKTKTYLVNDQLTNAYFEIHASRLIKFEGLVVPNSVRAERVGWGGMIAEEVFNALIKQDNSNKLVLEIMERMAQGVLNVKELFNKLSVESGEETVRKYLQTIDMSRHILNTLAIDGDDSFDIKSIALSGVKDVLDHMQMLLSSVSKIPVTILFGRSPGGQNATGDADFEQYHAMVEQIQRRVLQPKLMQFIYLLSKCSEYDINLSDKWHVKFNPLSIPTQKEQAETANLQAQADEHNSNVAKNYVAMNALDGQEIRNSGKLEQLGYELDTTLDNTGDMHNAKGSTI